MNRPAAILAVCAASVFLIFIFDAMQTISRGRDIFLKEGCTSCHSFKGQGGALAPDLTAVKDRRSTFWIMAQIKNPKTHNPDSRMPEFAYLSTVQRYAIARYIRN